MIDFPAGNTAAYASQATIVNMTFRSKGAALAHDILMVPVAWISAFWLRFNLQEIPPDALHNGLAALLVLLPTQTAAFYFFGLYRGIWRFASIPDILRIIKAVVFGTAFAMALLFLITRAEEIPRSVPVIYAVLLILLLGGPRLIYRWLKDRHLYLKEGERVLIVGAGQAGEMLARDILRNADEHYHPIAFVDDKQRRIGRDIHGIPVLGRTPDIPRLTEEYDIDLIMLAMPSITAKQMRKVVDYCEQSNVPFRSVPQMQDLLSGKVRIDDLREISIEDLLGRDPISLDWPAIRESLSGQRILVTGGGGSIGSELCLQLAAINPSQLILFENSEFNLYQIELELRKKHPGLDVQCLLGDVNDSRYVDFVFNRFQPEIIFHAAAFKHVPLLEAQIRQALRNNVLGTRNVAMAAHRFHCKTFVLISTDKAVNPTNIMGASKRSAEIFCQNLDNHSNTKYITVRFGNVLGSAGSVIPLFKKQIASGGPITVTDPRMERYFMTIPEACQLIMQTVVLGNGGEIFVLDMGEPVKITYLAEQMIRLSGKEPGVDITIEYIGLRPGEKLYEELFHAKEILEATPHKKVLLARHRQVDWSSLNKTLDRMNEAIQATDTGILEQLLRKLVPEYENQRNSTIKPPPASHHESEKAKNDQ